MYFVRRCYVYDGEPEYNGSSIIGIFENYETAKDSLIAKMTKMKYEYEIETNRLDYFFAKIDGKTKSLCFEICKKNIGLNEIKLKS